LIFLNTRPLSSFSPERPTGASLRAESFEEILKSDAPCAGRPLHSEQEAGPRELERMATIPDLC